MIGQLTPEQWRAVNVGSRTPEVIAANVGGHSPWVVPLIEHSVAGDSMLELGSGTGALSARLALAGRSVGLLDYSEEQVKFANDVFAVLGLGAKSYVADITKGLPVGDLSYDWVWSSGLLEHFSDEELSVIMMESARVARKGVMSLVPNANSLLYRVGKHHMETHNVWQYGYEDPKYTLVPQYEAAGLTDVVEYSVDPYSSINFAKFGRGEITAFLNSIAPDEQRRLNQGYLLFTIGVLSKGTD